MDHQFSVLHPFLSLSSISTSSSCSRLPSVVDDGLGRLGSPEVPFACGNLCSFHEHFLAFESFNVDF